MMAWRTAVSKRWLVVLALLVIVVACGGDPTEPAPFASAWIPDAADVPAAVARRTPLPPCGYTTPDAALPFVACIVGAESNGRSGELILDRLIDGTRAIQIVRVLSRGHVEIIYGTHPPGLPWLWELAVCDGIKAADGDRPGLTLGDCGPLTEIR